MPISREELTRRLEEAARVRVVLRKATREMQAVAEAVRKAREDRSRRPDGAGAPRE